MVRRIGIVGYGHLGQHLASCIEKSQDYELAFVWNRNAGVLKGKIRADLILNDLSEFHTRYPALVVEVSHPCITKEYCKLFLSRCDYMIGSPTALCDPKVENELLEASTSHAIFIPVGALWGAFDIQKMADLRTLKALRITMHFHSESLRLEETLGEISKTEAFSVVKYEGSVRGLCHLAPRNTNTMAVAAIAAHNLGFDNVQGCLIADPGLTNHHIIEVDAQGYPTQNGTFEVQSVRKNPSKIGHVTGIATYDAFFSSLKRAVGKSNGVHIC